MQWNEALTRLKQGNERFVEDSVKGELRDCACRETLTEGQTPFAIALCCADSRVVPELAFDTGIGEIFVVRVAGNIPNPSSIASIEYAVAHLGTKLILVLGHEGCGAVTAAVKGGDNGRNLNHLLGFITPVVQANQGAKLEDVIKANARNSVDCLTKNSDILADAVATNDVKIIPAYYSLSTGKVDFYDE
jgi:carbonic anhydrase